MTLVQLEKKHLLFCKQQADKCGKVCLHADETPNVKSLIEALRDLFSEAHLTTLPTTKSEVEECLGEGHFEEFALACSILHVADVN